MEIELEVLLDIFQKYKVNMVIMGHDHTHAITTFGITQYITMDALLDGEPNASILKIQVSAEKLGYEFQSISSMN